MERSLRITKDGSHTLYVPDLDEAYHSVHGAIQESMHVFIKHGLRATTTADISILEIGFGTGLNAILTLAEASQSGQRIHYHGVEKYPLSEKEFKKFNFSKVRLDLPQDLFLAMHLAPWGKTAKIGPGFELYKENADFRSMEATGPFDLVYFDAFDPQKQPYLWTEEIFSSIARRVRPGAVLVTYSAKGSVRRALISSGFNVQKLSGPPGKREMVRAIKR
jgi:tRNA U34 5-methylaminomethyl-2-thiouridine-forming methyltransferase MnmC